LCGTLFTHLLWVGNEDISGLLSEAHHGIMGAITGRAIYEGTLDFAQAQQLCDAK
jgi:phosphoribosylformimino-5-aminoimidazole carboxamide ribotide isomerase